jgi:hypothetical protein
MTIFFDSHGDAWETCDGADPDAEAFGPSGIAKRALEAPRYPEAYASGRVYQADDDAWRVLLPHPDVVQINLDRYDAERIEARLRSLDVNLDDAAEPLAWIMQALAVAQGHAGPGVRRAREV